MEFGRLDDVSNIDFTLPSDAFDPIRLWGGKPSAQPQVFVAPPSWGIKEWVGKIYPSKTSDKNFLRAYGQQYMALEHNATRYKIPSLEQTQTWAAQVPAGFRFCVKFPEIITHLKQLRDCEALTDEFLHGMAGFGDKVGPCLLLVHPNLSTGQAAKLFAYLRLLEGRIPYALELRHASWFSDRVAMEELRSYLIEQKQSLVITDVAGRRDALHMAPTNSEVFIRWTGNSLHPSDYIRMDDWAERLSQWLNQGLDTAYFFIHQPGKVLCPESCSYITQKLNGLTNLGLRDATYYNTLSLF